MTWRREVLPGQVGWLCSFPSAGPFALCLKCGYKHRLREEFGRRGTLSRLLFRFSLFREEPAAALARCGR